MSENSKREVPQMPAEYLGELLPVSGGAVTVPRKWTDGELAWIKKLLAEGFTAPEIARSVSRSVVSVHLKIKRLGKSSGSYNVAHLAEKYQKNREFFELLHPASVLDLYAGAPSFWRSNFPGVNVLSNDLDPSKPADHHERAESFALRLLLEGRRFDMVDLDPFGSAYPCFAACVQMAQKGLVVTYGEMGHRRWRRFDFVGCHYGIRDMASFSVEPMIRETARIALCHKKRLTPVFVLNWHYISRVYYRVEPAKVSPGFVLK